ncbi:MAG: hypothetical protein QME94_14395 [Anaerolineae bacterium]|nr:hypothetical protein [Anaerolineae bacterium]
MSYRAAPRPAPLLNSLLGVILLLVAALDLLMLGIIGWAVWQRSTLSEVRFRMRQEDAIQLRGAQREAEDLRQIIAIGRASISDTLQAFPTEADVARYVSGLRTHAWATGVSIVELDVRPAVPGAIPLRRFGLRVRGEWGRLLQFLNRVAQSCPSTGRLESLSLLQDQDGSELSFELVVAVRPEAPLAARTGPDTESTAWRAHERSRRSTDHG